MVPKPQPSQASAPSGEPAFKVPKIRMKRQNKQEAKGMLGGMNTGYGAENRMGGLHDNINPEGDSNTQNHNQGSPYTDQNQLQVD